MSDNLKQRVRTRFAPSPTGYMHIGNLRTALYAYLYAKKEQGDFILRIEDTDQKRFVADAVDFIKRTLAAAHITADEGPDIGGEYGPYVQSERKEIYQKYADELIASGHAYRCFCDSSAADEAEPAPADEADKYKKKPGHCEICRALSKEESDAKAAAGVPFVIRQLMPPSGPVTFYDIVHGNISIDASELEDQVLIKRDGLPTYNFANVIDDHLMDVSHIIRGVEFITSTPKHVLLYDFLGWTPPAFIHLPPVMGKNEDGSVSKLSKRHGSTGFSELVDLGYLPEAITNYVALLGWSPKSTQEIFSMEEMQAAFTLEGLSKSPAVFDYAKLDWFNSEYLKAMNDDDFAALARPYAREIADSLGDKWVYLAALLKTRVSRLGEIPEKIDFLPTPHEYTSEDFLNKKNKVTLELAGEIIPAATAALAAVDPADWNPDKINEALHAYIEASGKKMGTIMWPLRIALSGCRVTPGGVTELLYLLGKDESIARLNAGIAKLA